MTKITERTVNALAPGTRITDEMIEGFVARCLPSGKVSFGYQYTDKKTGKREWMGIGLHGAVTADEARTRAKEFAGKVAVHRNPAAEHALATARAENTVNYVLDEFLAKHVTRENLRSATAIKANFENHVRRRLGHKIIYDVTRGDIIKMIDDIGETHPRMAHIVHALLRGAFNFWTLRDEKFKNPIVRGMVKDKTKTRTRVLAPDELRDIWNALDEIKHVPECFASYVKVLMLTCCRRNEVADMHTDEIFGDRWTIPGSRCKTGHDHVVPLIPAIKKLLPKTRGFVFGCASHRHHLAAGEAPFKGFGKMKDELDKAIAAICEREHRKKMPAWTYHDLRRTGRTLLAELGVDRDVAEACLGHTMGGIAGVYNRHTYMKEKTAALTALAAHVDRITKARTPSAATKLRLVAG